MAIIVAGMVAGAVGVFSSIMTAFYLFSIPTLSPLIGRFLMTGDEIHAAVGAMGIFFLVVISLAARRVHKNILHLLTLQYEREDLIDHLRHEVHQRKAAQADLRRQKEKVEEIVDQRTAQLINTNGQLQKSEEKYRDLVENINDVIYAIDGNGQITYISPVIEKSLGHLTAEMLGKSFCSYVHPEDRQQIRSDFDLAMRRNLEQREYRLLTKTGEIKWCRISARPISENAHKRGIQGVLVDITASKLLEEQLVRMQKMEALGTLAGGVAHDLNNILSGIVSYPELLLMDLSEDSSLRKPLMTIKQSGENATAVVQDLLALARRGVQTSELVDLNRLITSCLHSADIQFLLNQHPSINVSTDQCPDLLSVHGSTVQIMKAIGNLITNAVESITDGGRIEIVTANRYADKQVTGFDVVEEGEYAVVTISDSGVGISETDRNRIFEPFYTKKIMGRNGSGLGMAVVWGTIKDHGGYIDLRSEEGQGTTIDLFFPATRDHVDTGHGEHESSDVTGRGESILVVDDMAVQREIATGIITKLGYTATSVASGEAAIEYLKNNSADLLILDMIMDPGIDGYETFRRIKQFCPEQKTIIASGYAETERVRQTKALGAGQYIKKPYTILELGVAIKRALAKDEV